MEEKAEGKEKERLVGRLPPPDAMHLQRERERENVSTIVIDQSCTHAHMYNLYNCRGHSASVGYIHCVGKGVSPW